MAQHISIPIDDLRPNPWNVNVVSPENEEKIAASLDELPFFKPLVVRETMIAGEFEILGGQHRWEQAKIKGWTHIDCWNVGVCTDDVAKKIMLADNARYGIDDSVELAKILEEIGADEAQAILPYSETDVQALFSSINIALDELDIDDSFDKTGEQPEPAAAKAPKTHTIMRFKVSLGDAEKLTELIAKTQKRQGLSGADELTNAGDALVHLLLGAQEDDA